MLKTVVEQDHVRSKVAVRSLSRERSIRIGQTSDGGAVSSDQPFLVVGFAPLKPAEFVIIKIQQIAGQLEA